PGYMGSDLPCCALDDDGDLRYELEDAAPDALWEAWEPPHHGELGTLVIHVPGQEMYIAACDGEGEPVVSAVGLLDALGHPGKVDAVRRELPGDGALQVLAAAAADDLAQRQLTAAGWCGEPQWVLAPAPEEVW